MVISCWALHGYYSAVQAQNLQAFNRLSEVEVLCLKISLAFISQHGDESHVPLNKLLRKTGVSTMKGILR